MKFDLEAPLIGIDGAPIRQHRDATAVTIRNALHMAISSAPIFMDGQAQGTARPLTPQEQMQRVMLMQAMVGDTLEITVEQAAEIKEMVRQGLSAALSIPLAALMDSGGNHEPV